jgi:hypothetical protein
MGNYLLKAHAQLKVLYQFSKQQKAQMRKRVFQLVSQPDKKHIPTNTTPNKSIITLSVNPWDLSIVPDSFNPSKIKVIFSDKSGHEFRYLSITDLGFHNYAEKISNGDNFSTLNDFIRSQKEVYVRLGLSREFTSPDGRTGYWLQVNGIYTFPEYFSEIRCYA